MKIYKNFLHSSDFEHIRNEIYSKTFPWYFNDSIVGYTGARYDFQFIHNFYNHGAPRSPYFEMIKVVSAGYGLGEVELVGEPAVNGRM